jgi:bifunctional enzyme CysN/CysC
MMSSSLTPLGFHARAAIKKQRARCFWFTGLPASGKSTIAGLLDRKLHAAGYHTCVLDGDEIRRGLSRDLGFSNADRAENNRRIAEVARLMVDAGLIVIVAFISPFRAERAFARSLFRDGDFQEVFIDTPLEVCERRDPKGLYAKARSGALANFTGLDSPYEPPARPDMWIRTAEDSAEQSADRLFQIVTPTRDGPQKQSPEQP